MSQMTIFRRIRTLQIGASPTGSLLAPVIASSFSGYCLRGQHLFLFVSFCATPICHLRSAPGSELILFSRNLLHPVARLAVQRFLKGNRCPYLLVTLPNN